MDTHEAANSISSIKLHLGQLEIIGVTVDHPKFRHAIWKRKKYLFIV